MKGPIGPFELLNVMPGHWCPKRAAGPEYAAGEIGGVAGTPQKRPSLKLTFFAPENGWLEYDPYYLPIGFRPTFRGEVLLVSGRK